jgi:acyl-CoA reductase-like NAD-dependent aldehyde dehydrogenase
MPPAHHASTSDAVARLAEHRIAGSVVPAAGRRELTAADPASGRPSLVLVPATTDEVATAVATADAARAGWRRTSPSERAGFLRAAAAG